MHDTVCLSKCHFSVWSVNNFCATRKGTCEMEKREKKNTHKTSQQCINSCCVVVVVVIVYVVLSGITKARQMKI